MSKSLKTKVPSNTKYEVKLGIKDTTFIKYEEIFWVL